MSAIHGIIGVDPALSFHCHFSGVDGLQVGCHNAASRPDVSRLLSVASGDSPLGVSVNGPNLGPSFARGFQLFCGGFIRGRGGNVVAFVGFSAAGGDVDGGIACSRAANKEVAHPRGVGNG